MNNDQIYIAKYGKTRREYDVKIISTIGSDVGVREFVNDQFKGKSWTVKYETLEKKLDQQVLSTPVAATTAADTALDADTSDAATTAASAATTAASAAAVTSIDAATDAANADPAVEAAFTTATATATAATAATAATTATAATATAASGSTGVNRPIKEKKSTKKRKGRGRPAKSKKINKKSILLQMGDTVRVQFEGGLVTITKLDHTGVYYTSTTDTNVVVPLQNTLQIVNRGGTPYEGGEHLQLFDYYWN